MKKLVGLDLDKSFNVAILCLFLNLISCSGEHGFPSSVIPKGIPFNDTHSSKNISSSKEYTQTNGLRGGFALKLNTTGSFLTHQKSSDDQNRVNRGTVTGSHNDRSTSFLPGKPSLWEIFRTSFFPKTEFNQQQPSEHNSNAITAPQNHYNNNQRDNNNQEKDTLAWDPWEKLKSAASKSIFVSYLPKFGKTNSDTKVEIENIKSSPHRHHTERHSPLAVDLSVDFNSPSEKRGRLIHNSLKTFLNVQNSLLNYVLGKHGQPLLKTTTSEPTKQPSLHELILKPLSQLLTVHNHLDSTAHNENTNPAKDLATAPSEHKVVWNAWESYPWKEHPKWDPWSYNYHIQRPATEGTLLRFWKKLLWGALRTKKNVVKAKASILPLLVKTAKAKASIIPLLVKIKINALKSVLEKIANKEKSPTFLLLRIIRNALWKGKKAFIRQFLKAKNHVSAFKSKLKFFKHTAPTTESYGDGQDISNVHLTYDTPRASPSPESYHTSVKPSYYADSSSYQLLPPEVENPTYIQTQYEVVTTQKPKSASPYTSDYHISSPSESSYGKIVPVPLKDTKTYSQPIGTTENHSRPVKKNVSFSSQLLQLKSQR